MLEEAKRRRPPTLLRTLAQAYAAQVEQLDDMLASIEPHDWRHPDPRHGDVQGMLGHLADNDGRLTADIGGSLVPSGLDVRTAWHRQSQLLLGRLAASGSLTLDRPVRLAARGESPIRPLREALIQRTFETWTHREDLASVVGRSHAPPPPDQIRRIVDLSVQVLPSALKAAGLVRRGDGVRLVLEGPGEGEWIVPLGHPEPVARIEATIRAEAVQYARLVAGRQDVRSLNPIITGASGIARPLLMIASTLGCD